MGVVVGVEWYRYFGRSRQVGGVDRTYDAPAPLKCVLPAVA